MMRVAFRWLLVVLALAVAGPAEANTISGRIRFEDFAAIPTGIGTATLKPVRFGTVIVQNASQVTLATGRTDASGNYSVAVTDQGTVALTLIVEARIDDATLRLHLRVQNNTTQRAQLSASATRNVDTSAAAVLDFDIPRTGGGGGAFNIFDNGVTAQLFMNSVSSLQPPLITYYWQPVLNGPGSDDGIYFQDFDNSIHLMHQTSNSDEYDDAVILHETGHYIVASYSVDRSLGGTHFVNVNHSDIRLAYSEGLASWISCQLRNDPQLVNSLDDNDSSTYEIEVPDFAADTTGQDTEQTVSAVLWDIMDTDATPGHTVPGVDDDPIELADGLNRIYQILLNDFTQADDGLLEDFVTKWYARFGASFQRPQLTSILEGRKVFIERPNLFRNPTDVSVPANAITESTLSVPANIRMTTVNVFVALVHRDPTAVVMTLQAPSGTSMLLHNREQNASPDGYFDWYSRFDTPVSGGDPDTTFRGQNSSGAWKLRIDDRTTGTSGILDDWRLDIKGDAEGADLALSGVTGPATAVLGQTIGVSATVANQGTLGTPNNVVLRFVLSADATITSADTTLGDVAVASLQAAETRSVSGSFAVPGGLPIGTYFLGAIVDAQASVTESREDNNIAAGNSIVIQSSPPDLVVTNITPGAGTTAGGPFDVTGAVTNQGGQNAAGPFVVQAFLSSTSVLGGGAILLGTFTINSLAAGATQAVSSTFTVPAGTAPGSYFLVLRADATNVVVEGNETNNDNASSGAVIFNPSSPVDLIVTEVQTLSTGFLGATLPVTIRTANGGGVSTGNGFTNRVFLSASQVVDGSSLLIATRLKDPLGPGQADIDFVEPTLPVTLTSGTYFVVVQADATGLVTEGNENNNTASSGGVVIGSALADLVIPSITVPTLGSIGSTIPVTFTLQNQGQLAAAGPILTRIVASTDQTVSLSDFLLGDVTTGDLAAGASISVTADAPIPGTLGAGIYFIGAIVNPTNTVTETRTDNNGAISTTSTAITAGNTPDLAALSILGPSNGRVGIGGQLAITASVGNLGGQPIPVVFSNRVFLSTDRVRDANDVFLGEFQVAGLAAGQTASRNLSPALPPGTQPGNYFLILLADSLNQVSDPDRANNVLATTTAVAVTVDQLADLDPTSVLAPLDLVAGSTFRVTEGLRNAGNVPALAGHVSRWFISTDAILDTSDRAIGDFSNGTIQPGTTQVLSRTLQLPTDTVSATHFLGFQADATSRVFEVSELNNFSDTFEITVTSVTPGPDLRIRSAPSVSPTNLGVGGFGVLSVRVANDGASRAVGPFSLGIYLSKNVATDRAGTFLGSASVPTIEPGQESAELQVPFQLPPATPLDIYFVGAFADVTNSVSESREDNNGSTGTTLVAVPAPVIADLSPLTVDVPPGAARGQTTAFNTRIANNGLQSTFQNFFVDFFITSPALGDRSLGRVDTAAMGPRSTRTISLSAPLPSDLPDDAYRIKVRVDPTSRIVETDEANNELSSPLSLVVTSTGTLADLIPTSMNVPARAVIGNTVGVTVNVTNSGEGTSPNGVASSFYLSTDDQITTSDTLLSTFSLSPLPKGTERTFSPSGRIPVGFLPGNYFLGVLVNIPQTIAEEDRTNNAISAPIELIGAADLVPIQLTAAPNPIVAGRPLTVTSRVRNNGLASASPPPSALVNHFFLSRDTTLDDSDLFIGVQVLPVSAGIPVTAEVVGNALALNVPAETPPGNWFLAIKTNGNDQVVETDKTNNVLFLGGALVVQGAPTLVPVRVTGPVTARGAETMTVDVTVRNRGRTLFTGSLDIAYKLARELVPDVVFDVTTVTHAGVTLAPDQELVLRRVIGIPTSIPQDLYRIQVVTDPQNRILEIDEAAATHTKKAEGTTALYQPGSGALVALSYSRPVNAPLPPGPLAITATFDRPVSGPRIAIDAPGATRLSPTPMSGSGRVFQYSLVIPPADGVVNRDGRHVVRISDAVDQTGAENQPAATNFSFVTDSAPPVFAELDVTDGATLPERPALHGRVVDPNIASAALSVEGSDGSRLSLALTLDGDGRFALESGAFRLPTRTATLRFTATDRGGNAAPPLVLAVQRDLDGDRLPDAWEITYGLDPANSSDADRLMPGSGATYRQAFDHGLDPRNPPAGDPFSRLPVAEVAPSATVRPGRVGLDGAASFDPLRRALHFAWTQVEGPEVVLEAAGGSRPWFVGKKPGRYGFELRVSSAGGQSSPAVQVVDILPLVPVAEIAPGGRVLVGETALLDGAASRDPNEDIVRHRWTGDAANPPNHVLQPGEGASASFVPLEPGTYTFRLTVEDATGLVSDETSVTFLACDPATGAVAPTADAGIDQAARPGTVVTLDGSASRAGAAGRALGYRWIQVSGPPVTVSAAASSRAFFVPSAPGLHVFELEVQHLDLDRLEGAPDRTEVLVSSSRGTAPTAVTGGDQVVSLGDSVLLDGSASVASEPGPLLFSWTQTAGPEVELSATNVDRPTFVAHAVGAVELELRVIQGALISAPQRTRVTVLTQRESGVPVARATLVGVTHGAVSRLTIPEPSPLDLRLDASGSYDPSGRPFTRRWHQVEGPPTLLSGLEESQPTLRITQPGVYGFELEVFNGESHGRDRVTFLADTAARRVPVASASGTGTTVGQSARLQGGGGGLGLRLNVTSGNSYAWSQAAGPLVVLSNPNAAIADFVPEKAGTYSFQLYVSDGELRSMPSTVQVDVGAAIGGGSTGATGSGGSTGSGGGSSGGSGGSGGGTSGSTGSAGNPVFPPTTPGSDEPTEPTLDTEVTPVTSGGGGGGGGGGCSASPHARTSPASGLPLALFTLALLATRGRKKRKAPGSVSGSPAS